MVFQPGQSGNPKGPAKGFKQRCTEVREAWFIAFEEMGGMEELLRWGNEKANRRDFYKIMSSLLPKDIKIEGDKDEPLRIIYRATRTDRPTESKAG